MKLFRKADKPLTQEEITNWLIELRSNPHNPVSNFGVTAIFRVKYNNDDLYYFAGVNVENPAHHRLSTHAEEGCIAAIATAFGKKGQIVEGWLMGALKQFNPGDTNPLANVLVTCCGKCRQQVAGMAASDAKIHSISLNKQHQETTVAQFLPDAFTFQQYVPEAKDPSLLNAMALTPGEIINKIVRKTDNLNNNEIFAWLRELESIDYATQTGQAVVLKLNNGHYVAGVNIEEAAFVSMDPIQCATAIANTYLNGAKVEAVWTLPQNNKPKPAATSSKDAMLLQFAAHKEQTETNPEDSAFCHLGLSSLEVLNNFVVNNEIPMWMFNRKGEIKKTTMVECAIFKIFKAEISATDKYEPPAAAFSKFAVT